MTRNPVVLAGVGLALLAAPAWAQTVYGAPDAAVISPVATASPDLPPPAKPNAVRPELIQEQHLADQQKALAAKRHDLVLKQQALAKQQGQLAAQKGQLSVEQKQLASQQAQLAAEQRKLAQARQARVASLGKPMGCGNFAGKPRDAATCRAIRQQMALNHLGPYNRVPPVPGE